MRVPQRKMESITAWREVLTPFRQSQRKQKRTRTLVSQCKHVDLNFKLHHLHLFSQMTHDIAKICASIWSLVYVTVLQTFQSVGPQVFRMGVLAMSMPPISLQVLHVIFVEVYIGFGCLHMGTMPIYKLFLSNKLPLLSHSCGWCWS